MFRDATVYRPGLVPSEHLGIAGFSERHLRNPEGRLRGQPLRLNSQQRGVLSAFDTFGVEFVVLRWSAQSGKSTVFLSTIGHAIGEEPTSVLMVVPTVKPMAEAFSRERLDPMVASSPKLRDVVATRRSAAGSNTLLAKQWPGGSLAIAGANSGPSLASRAIQVGLFDELDKWPGAIKREGSVLDLALERLKSFIGQRRVLMASTPASPDDVDNEGGAGQISREFEKGDQCEWHVRCECGHVGRITWDGETGLRVTWEPGEPETAAVLCQSCGKVWSEAERRRAIAAGEWVATTTAVDSSYRSFALWTGETEWGNLVDCVRKRVVADRAAGEGDFTPLRAWVQGTLGEPYDSSEEADQIPEIAKLRTAVLDRRGKVAAPEGERVVTVGAVDVQLDRVEALTMSCTLDGLVLWILERERFYGEPSDSGDLCWEDAHAWLADRGVRAVNVDSGDSTDAVYEVVGSPAWRDLGAAAIKGTATGAFMRPPTPPDPIVSGDKFQQAVRARHVRRTVPLWLVGTVAGKRMLYRRLALAADDDRAVHVPDWFTKADARELVSEIEVNEPDKHGRPRIVWKQLQKRNELLDLTLYALHAVRRMGKRL